MLYPENHAKFNRSVSSTLQKGDEEFTLQYVTGYVKGVTAYDTVLVRDDIGAQACCNKDTCGPLEFSTNVLLVYVQVGGIYVENQIFGLTSSEGPFLRYMPWDGVQGLAFLGVSSVGGTPLFSNMWNQGKIPQNQFSMYLSK